MSNKLKCENCYHKDFCNGRFDVEEYGCRCEDYKDKSLIIELPCKVGDDLYWINDEYEVKCQKNAIAGIVVTSDGFEIIDTDNNRDKLGTRYAYLTHKEAEKALKEYNY